jgi:HD-GYP domain-containing protein (c-di-GMP phosphodiesterase class II)
MLRVAALFHDVDKIGVPDRILRKPGALTREEVEFMDHHSLVVLGRILAVADAYSAMSTDRPYRAALRRSGQHTYAQRGGTRPGPRAPTNVIT